MNNRQSNLLDVSKVIFSTLVVTSHYLPFFMGIKFYTFATSGFFIIAGYYAYNFETRHGRSYFFSRVTRLIPAFYLTFFLFLFFKNVSPDKYFQEVLNHLSFFLYTNDIKAAFSLNPAFWSMPVFFGFYLFRSFFYKINKNLLLIISFLLLIFLNTGGYRWMVELYLYPIGLFLNLFFFMLGAVCLDYKPLHFSKMAFSTLSLIFFIGIIFIGLNYNTMPFFGKFFPGDYDLVMSIIFILFLYFISNSAFVERSFLLLKKYASISFTIYLSHNLFLVFFERGSGFVSMLSALFLTIAFSVLVTFLFEKPILKFFKTRFNNR